VPISDTGIASATISVARQLCRNSDDHHHHQQGQRQRDADLFDGGRHKLVVSNFTS
jgi:hypothetical protein